MLMSTASHTFSLASVPKCSYDAEKERPKMAMVFDKYKDRLRMLPKEKGWATENLYMYQGFWHQSKVRMSLEAVMALQDTFIAQPNDIYLVTMPKSGTTWLKALVFAIVNRKRYKNNSLLTDHPLLVSNPHNCLPFLETEVFRYTPTYVNAHSPRLFATHTPYSSLPPSILESGCPLIYLCRNPKDVLVSMFHFVNKFRDKSWGEMAFEEAFESFSKGVVPLGPFWDHVKRYHKATSEHPGRVLFLTYEDMKMDPASHVKRIANFIGYTFTEEEEAESAVQEIVSLCSFENLRQVNKYGNVREGLPNDAFFRKGEVGDWTNHLTDEMSQNLDRITREKFHDLDISFVERS